MPLPARARRGFASLGLVNSSGRLFGAYRENALQIVKLALRGYFAELTAKAERLGLFAPAATEAPTDTPVQRHRTALQRYSLSTPV